MMGDDKDLYFWTDDDQLANFEAGPEDYLPNDPMDPYNV